MGVRQDRSSDGGWWVRSEVWGAGAGSGEAIGLDWILGCCPLDGLEERLGLPPLPQGKKRTWKAKTSCSRGRATWVWPYLPPPPHSGSVSPHCSPSQSYCPQLALRGGGQWELAG